MDPVRLLQVYLHSGCFRTYTEGKKASRSTTRGQSEFATPRSQRLSSEQFLHHIIELHEGLVDASFHRSRIAVSGKFRPGALVRLLAAFCHILHTLLCLLGQVASEKARDEHACDQCMLFRHALQRSLELSDRRLLAINSWIEKQLLGLITDLHHLIGCYIEEATDDL